MFFFCKISAQKVYILQRPPSCKTRDALFLFVGENLAQLFDGSHVGPQIICQMPQAYKNVSNLKICVKISRGQNLLEEEMRSIYLSPTSGPDAHQTHLK